MMIHRLILIGLVVGCLAALLITSIAFAAPASQQRLQPLRILQLYGAAQPGGLLHTTKLVWKRNPTSVQYKWSKCSVAAQTCLPLQTRGTSYRITSQDDGWTIEVTAIAHLAHYRQIVYSQPSAPVSGVPAANLTSATASARSKEQLLPDSPLLGFRPMDEIVPQSYAEDVENDNPTVYYQMNDASEDSGNDTAIDSSGNSFSGTYHGAFLSNGFTPQVPGVPGSNDTAAVFGNGTYINSSLTGNDIPVSNPWSFESSFITPSFTSNANVATLASVGNAWSNSSLAIWLAIGQDSDNTQTQRMANIFYGTGPYTTGMTLPTPLSASGSWNHLIISINPATQTMEVDLNDQFSEFPYDGPINQPSSSDWLFGTWAGCGSSCNFTGTLDDTAIYNHALTTEEMASHDSWIPLPLGIYYPYHKIDSWIGGGGYTDVTPAVSGGTDGQTLTYSSLNLPNGLSVDSSTGEISGVMDENPVNPLVNTQVTVTSSDGETATTTVAFNTHQEDLAQRFRPLLYFDTDESWFPLNVDDFFNEPNEWSIDANNDNPSNGAVDPEDGGEICAFSSTELSETTNNQVQPQDADFCKLTSLDSTPTATLQDVEADIQLYDSGDTAVLVMTPNSSWGLNADSPGMADNMYQTLPGYASPNPACRSEAVGGDVPDDPTIAAADDDSPVELDCNGGSASSYYYNESADSSGEVYYDYWGFYRYNEYEQSNYGTNDNDDHQGDWDSEITVATHGGNPSTFDYAIYVAHGEQWYYLRDALACDGGESGSETCGTSSAPSGNRPDAFISEDNHAAYPDACESSCEETYYTGVNGITENNFDGELPWGNNTDLGALIGFPTVSSSDWQDGSEGPWTDWPGPWGGSTGHSVDGHSLGQSPQSPGNQTSFQNPQAGIDGCTTRWSYDSTGCGVNYDALQANSLSSLNKSKISQRKTPDVPKMSCPRWRGPGVSVIICNLRQIGNAKQTLHYMNAQRIHTWGLGKQAEVASVPGLVQIMSAPLSQQHAVLIRKSLLPGTHVQMLVRLKGKNVVWVDAIIHKRLLKGATLEAIAAPDTNQDVPQVRSKHADILQNHYSPLMLSISAIH